jgi:hypothetical protein
LEIQNGRRPTCQCPALLNGRWRRTRVTAAPLPATSRPHCRPSAGRVCPSRPALPPRRSSWEKAIHSLLQLTRRRFTLLHLRRAHHTGELLRPPIPSQFTAAAAPSHHSYLSSCAGSPGEAQNRHPAASLSAPTADTSEGFTPCAFVQSPLLAAMPQPSDHFPSVPEAREALYPVEPPRRR